MNRTTSRRRQPQLPAGAAMPVDDPLLSLTREEEPWFVINRAFCFWTVFGSRQHIEAMTSLPAQYWDLAPGEHKCWYVGTLTYQLAHSPGKGLPAWALSCKKGAFRRSSACSDMLQKALETALENTAWERAALDGKYQEFRRLVVG